MMRKSIFVPLLLWLCAALSFGQVTLGEKVPNFTATDQNGTKWALNRNLRSADYLVIYFYPAAFTGGCTRQACSYRDQKRELEQVNASVVGVSGDKPETLELFALQNQLNFTLLSDEKGEIATMFGVPQNPGGSIQHEMNGKKLNLERGTTIQRWTFILDNKGTLIYKDSEVNAAEDSGRVVEFLSSLET
jgi:peroxiredoxin Q/BCP